ncbi:unnamed protein product [Dovyalis caffra]|uniref:Uncharacterized protein n=1 Tax=Dovyalis caffra TaxID=77055 RepID=A0AAV1R3L6_9ROSI|nr:unnamed protein product [Dovyalis caffra]
MGDFVWMEEYTDAPQLFAPPSTSKRKARMPRKFEFTGWGSTLLIEFLKSIDIDTTNQISQHDVTAIINKYVKDRNLLHPTKKKRVICDEWLLPLFLRKTISRIRIYDLLEPHFAENKVGSDDDFFDTSDYEVDNACECRKSSASEKKLHSKKRVFEAPKSCFAAIVSDNIKLVYLKRSLVQDLAKNNPETFQRKIVGSFVRIKSDPNDYLQKNSHMLVQVTGSVESSSTDNINAELLLEVSNYIKDVQISMLSDDNFSKKLEIDAAAVYGVDDKEECEDLNRRVRDGSLKRPTVVELEEKVQVLHEDITKQGIMYDPRDLFKVCSSNFLPLNVDFFQWLRGELAFLQKLIDRANEKAFTLFEYLEKKKLLETPDEQTRLLLDIPKVIAEELEVELVPEDFPVDIKRGNDGSPKSSLNGVLEIPNSDVASNKTSLTWISFSKNSADCQHDVFVEDQPKQSTNIFKESNSEMLSVNIEEKKHPQRTIDVQVIDLSDSEEDEGPRHRDSVQTIDCDRGSCLWLYLDPQGDIQGPFSLTLLKHWNDSDYFPPGFKVWKTGQSQNKAVLLSDILHRLFTDEV